jgi:hypothetical protein
MSLESKVSVGTVLEIVISMHPELNEGPASAK